MKDADWLKAGILAIHSSPPAAFPGLFLSLFFHSRRVQVSFIIYPVLIWDLCRSPHSVTVPGRRTNCICISIEWKCDLRSSLIVEHPAAEFVAFGGRRLQTSASHRRGQPERVSVRNLRDLLFISDDK